MTVKRFGYVVQVFADNCWQDTWWGTPSDECPHGASIKSKKQRSRELAAFPPRILAKRAADKAIAEARSQYPEDKYRLDRRY